MQMEIFLNADKHSPRLSPAVQKKSQTKETGFTASAVNLFVRRSKKNEFELFWGNETGGCGKVGRDVSEAFGFLSR